MEFVEGMDVSKLVRHLGAVAAADACEIVRQAALGLAHVQSIAGTDGSQFAGRSNGDYFLTTGVSATVLDDNAADVLTGSSGQDWFFFNADGEEGTAKDKATDLSASEFAGDLDWIENGF